MTDLLRMRPPGPFLGGLVAFAATLPRGCIVAEIGSYRGESARVFASVASKLYCIDPWIDYVELNPEFSFPMTDLARAEAEFDQVVKEFPGIIVKYKMTSAQAAALFANKSLDAAYLDGDHAESAVREDIGLWRPKIKIGGVLAGHDYRRRSGVTAAVDALLGKPTQVFEDATWSIPIW